MHSNLQASWKMSLRNSFKNFRRDSPSDETVQAPSKRARLAEEDFPADEINDDEYKAALEEIKEEYRRGKEKNQSKLKQLMERTQQHRLLWIKRERPLISEIIDIFPCLATSKGVSMLGNYFLNYLFYFTTDST